MAEKTAKYTLWTIPKSEWTHSWLQNIKFSQADKDEMLAFAKTLDDSRLDELLRPFNTPVSQETLNKPVSQ